MTASWHAPGASAVYPGARAVDGTPTLARGATTRGLHGGRGRPRPRPGLARAPGPRAAPLVQRTG
jgi:hypothetical protein